MSKAADKAVSDFLAGKVFQRGTSSHYSGYRDASDGQSLILWGNKIAWRDANGKLWADFTWDSKTTQARLKALFEQIDFPAGIHTYKGDLAIDGFLVSGHMRLQEKIPKTITENYEKLGLEIIQLMRESRLEIDPIEIQRGFPRTILVAKIKGEIQPVLAYLDALYTYEKAPEWHQWGNTDFGYRTAAYYPKKKKWNFRISNYGLREDDFVFSQLISQFKKEAMQGRVEDSRP